MLHLISNAIQVELTGLHTRLDEVKDMEETKPDIENEFAEFWIDNGATKYLRTDIKTGNVIPALTRYYVARARLKETGQEAFVIAGNGKIRFESKTYEAMCYECDKIKLLVGFKKKGD